ncbi:NUDIX hydrolase [Candidatus Saccharibacteria bacterium]|nr:NUDIX hydrolase [Candidatus Saccharibacteria bacterium]
METIIKQIIEQIKPLDDLELEHIVDTIRWIDSGAEIFRITKPGNPPRHLVSYFVLYDTMNESIMLIDHIPSGLCLPSGGHVELNEHPKTTVLREAKEELSISASFDTQFGDNPLFLTVTPTIGQNQHTDVSLWYIISGNRDIVLNFDKREISGYRWLSIQEVLSADISKFDPHIHRFARKIQKSITLKGLH